MADQPLQEALAIIQGMTQKLEQSASRENAAAYIGQLNHVYEALLLAISLDSEVKRLQEVAAANNNVHASDPKTLDVTHAIDSSVLTHGTMNDVTKAIGEALDTTAALVAKAIVASAGVRGGYDVIQEPCNRLVRIRYSVGIHHTGGKSFDDVLKDLGTIMKQIRKT